MRDPRDVDLNLLVVFHELFQHRQVSVAARRLGQSQPTVSNALARLRKTFGDELFVRTSQGMQPTPLALEIAEPISMALTSVREALNPNAAFDPATSDRQFVIAMTDVGELHFMPLLVEHCAAAARGLRVSSVRLRSIDLRAEMETGKVDLAVGAFTDLPEGLYHRRLFSQRYVLLFRKGHPIGRGTPTLDDVLAAQHLIVASRESPYDRINQKLEKIGITQSSQFRVPHFTAVPYIVSTSDLVVTVPEKLAQRAAAAFGLAYASLPVRLPSLQTNMFWHRRFNQDGGNRWMRDFIAGIFVE
jgi:DNA-binding transcriptional LysR family regulator